MRDIRPDLRERLDAFAKEKAPLKERIAAIEAAEEGVKTLLAREEQRYGGNGSPQAMLQLRGTVDDNGFGKTPLARLILDALKGKKQPIGLADFKRFALESRFDFGEKSPGRTLHWALVGLAENGHLECSGAGPERRYQLKEVTQ